MNTVYRCDWIYQNCPIFKTSHLLAHLRPKFFHPLDLGRPISNEPLLLLPLQIMTNQLKENIIKDDYYMSSGPSFRSAFIFSINSLILPGFSLTSFHLTKASLSAFSWHYTLVCAAVQKYHEMSFIIIHIFSTHFAINQFYFHSLKT